MDRSRALHIQDKPDGEGGRPLSGRTVLFCFLGFFAVVATVNAIMVRAAISTFGGVETGGAYKAGLAFSHEIDAARRQEARAWQVTAHLERNADGDAVIDVDARDGAGRVLTGVSAHVRLAHPAFARRDHVVELTDVGPGRFRGSVAAEAGHWDLVVDLLRGEERVFRSRNRVVLRAAPAG